MDRVRRAHGVDLVRPLVEDVRAHAAVRALQAEAARDDEVDHCSSIRFNVGLGMSLHGCFTVTRPFLVGCLYW